MCRVENNSCGYSNLKKKREKEIMNIYKSRNTQ